MVKEKFRKTISVLSYLIIKIYHQKMVLNLSLIIMVITVSIQKIINLRLAIKTNL